MIEPKQKIQGVEWEDFRNSQGGLDLIHLYEWIYSEKADDNVHRYLKAIMCIKEITSRQLAAASVVNARAFKLFMQMP